jgi:SnoaL-like domain
MHIRILQILLMLLLIFPVGLAAVPKSSSSDLAAQVKKLQEQVTALQQKADRAQDYIAICNLQAAYGYYVDKAQWDQVADLFARDGTAEIGLRGVWVGQDRVRAYMHKLPELKYGTLFNHMQLQPVIDVAPDGMTAKGRWRAIMQVGILHRSAQWGEATYENTYVKEDGVWKINNLHAYFTYYANYYKGWDQGGDPPPGPIPGFPPDRPPTETYKLYPDVYIPPYHYKNPVTGK